MQHSSLQKPTELSSVPQKLPIKVVFVLKELEDQHSEVLRTIKQYCQEEQLMVETRQYDSSKYKHDRDEVARLPAFHLYLNGILEQTFYPNGCPIQIIQVQIERYKRKQQERLAKKGRFQRAFARAVSAMRRWTHRKTRIEKQNEIDALAHQIRERTRSQSFRDRMPSMMDWE
jgi:hypothetical protein